jgi:ribosomal protein S18 acetylase RimI-like enzyme
MEPGEEDRVSSLVTRVVNRHVAPLFREEGIREFLEWVAPGAIQQRSNSNHFVPVAGDGHHILGVIKVRDHSHVSLLLVDTAFQNPGIARELLTRALATCRRQRPMLREIDVNSSPNAVSTYERLGFRQRGPDQIKNGIRFVPMVLDLSGCGQTLIGGGS